MCNFIPSRPFQTNSTRQCGAASSTDGRKNVSSWGKPQLTCSINIPRQDFGFLPCNFIHSRPFQTNSTRWRGAAPSTDTVKKLSNWGKPQSTCSINIPRLEHDLAPCHFIHSRPIQTNSIWQCGTASNDGSCGEVMTKFVKLGQTQDFGFLPCNFIHSWPIQTNSTRRRGAALSMDTVKKVVKLGQTQVHNLH